MSEALSKAYDKVMDYVSSKKGTVSRRPLVYKVLNIIENADTKSYLVSAPTGYGKTAVSMSVALNEFARGSKVIVSYPLRTLIEEQVIIMKELFDFHGVGRGFVGARYMGFRESPYLVHPVTMTTIDTLSLTALGLSPEDIDKVFRSMRDSWFSNLGHYLFAWSSVFSSSFIILDEVHMMYDSSKSLSFLKALLDLCDSMDVKVILMTATFPMKFEEVLFNRGGRIRVGRALFSREEDPKFYEERNSKKYNIELLHLGSDEKLIKIRNILREKDFNRALVLFNTVEDAVNFYKLIEGTKILIHSRFTIEDRKTKMSELSKLRKSSDKYVIVGTQAVEAGMDVSSDLIITEVAPPISLVQRFGRFLRYDEKFGRAFIWVEEEVLDCNEILYKVYDRNLIKITLDYLSSNKDLNLHISYEDFINYVYREEPRVNNDLIIELRSILWDLLEPSRSAMELLLKLEGSFVREGNNFVALSENGFEVNVNYNYLEKLKSRGLCVNCPKNEYDALLRSLAGEKFKVNVSYDREVGLV